MTLFLAKAVFGASEGRIVIPGGTLQSQGADIVVTREDRTPGELRSYGAYIEANGESLKERLNALREVLNMLKENGQI